MHNQPRTIAQEPTPPALDEAQDLDRTTLRSAEAALPQYALHAKLVKSPFWDYLGRRVGSTVNGHRAVA